MIRAIVDFALNSRFVVLSMAVLLFIWGIISFHNLPVEAYPDVANTWVQVITQWPGRAAEEVEQQVTIPIEIQMNGIPHLQHVRSASLAGLSVVNLIFDDNSDNDWDRQKALERLSQVTLPPGVAAGIGPDFSPIGSVYWYTLKSTNPAYDLMDLKALQDWVISKYIRSVPDVVDDSSFGGVTREYQVRVDPEKLISYGLSLAQVEQQLTNANANVGGSFIEQGSQQINVRGVGLVTDVRDIEKTVIKAQNGTPLRIRDIAVVTQGPKIRLGQIGRAYHRADGVVEDDNDVVEGVVFLRKGADTATMLEGLHAMVNMLNDHILPPGVNRNFLFDFKHGDNSTPIWLACDIVKQDFHPDRAQRSDIRTSSAEIVRYSATFATPRPAQPLGDWIPLLTGPTSFLSRRYRQQRDPTQHRPEPPTRQMSFRQQ